MASTLPIPAPRRSSAPHDHPVRPSAATTVVGPVVGPVVAAVFAAVLAVVAVTAAAALVQATAHRTDGVTVGAADGRIGDRVVTMADADEPAIAHLTPALRQALVAATRAAARDGVAVDITSGWRSRTYQRQLLDEAIKKYGGRAQALRWVRTPDTSRHVSGNAVDVAAPGAAWLAAHGSAYGLCRAYANESWHFELLTHPGGTCPPEHADGAS